MCIKKKIVAMRVVSATDRNFTTNDVEIFTKVLGPLPSYLRDLGYCIKLSNSPLLFNNTCNTYRAL